MTRGLGLSTPHFKYNVLFILWDVKSNLCSYLNTVTSFVTDPDFNYTFAFAIMISAFVDGGLSRQLHHPFILRVYLIREFLNLAKFFVFTYLTFLTTQKSGWIARIFNSMPHNLANKTLKIVRIHLYIKLIVEANPLHIDYHCSFVGFSIDSGIGIQTRGRR